MCSRRLADTAKTASGSKPEQPISPLALGRGRRVGQAAVFGEDQPQRRVASAARARRRRRASSDGHGRPWRRAAARPARARDRGHGWNPGRRPSAWTSIPRASSWLAQAPGSSRQQTAVGQVGVQALGQRHHEALGAAGMQAEDDLQQAGTPRHGIQYTRSLSGPWPRTKSPCEGHFCARRPARGVPAACRRADDGTRVAKEEAGRGRSMIERRLFLGFAVDASSG